MVCMKLPSGTIPETPYEFLTILNILSSSPGKLTVMQLGVDHLTFDGWGVVWVRFFISQTSGDVLFFPCHALYSNVRFFTGLYPTRDIFFSPGISLLYFFFPQNQSVGYFFLKSPIPQITTQQSKWSAPYRLRLFIHCPQLNCF